MRGTETPSMDQEWGLRGYRSHWFSICTPYKEGCIGFGGYSSGGASQPCPTASHLVFRAPPLNPW